MAHMELPEVIEQIRRKKNWKKKDLADFLGVVPGTFSPLKKTFVDNWRYSLKLLDLCEELEIPARVKPHLRAVNDKSRKGLRLP